MGAGSVLAQGAVRPVLTGPIILGDGNTLDFLRIAGTSGDAVDGEGQNGGTISNCEFANITAGGTGGDGIVGINIQGTWTVSGTTFTNLAGSAMGFSTEGTSVGTVNLSGNTMTANGGAGIILRSEGTSDLTAFVIENVFSGNNTVTGNAFELVCADDSAFCLDLEENTNDDVYRLLDGNSGTSVLSIEQFAANGLTTPKPAGAGNTGTVNDSTGIGGDTPTSINDGDCSL